MRKANIINYFLAALLSIAPLCAVDLPPLFCHDMAIETDAGLIHFEFVKHSQSIPGLLQGIAAIDAEHSAFELANGSRWDAHNIEMIHGWVPGDQLVISQNQAFFSPRRFALVNLRLGKATPISLDREARPSTEDSLYVVKIDYANDIVTVNKDNQEWEVYSQDHGTLRRFAEHDRILLGINTSDCCDRENHMHYILINTASHQCVRARPLNR